jgi:hypothetical protein
MLIANPIYDTVFKFLLEDLTVARRLLSVLIGEEIVSLDVRPQEQTTSSNQFLLTVFRVDFKAIVRTDTGEQKKILIELQKGKQAFDILRFRHYLGTNYSQADEVDGVKVALPVLPIYFLGFKLDLVRPVLRVNRVYRDIGTGETVPARDPFIEKLTHDCIVVQIPALPASTQNRVERLLSVFSQRWVLDADTKWFLNYPADADDQDLSLIVNRLAMAAQSETVRGQMQAEEQLDEFIISKLRENEQLLEKQDQLLSEKDQALEQKDQALEQKDQALEQKDQALEEQKRENAELLRRIAELERQQNS